jgi:hypothetical protein
MATADHIIATLGGSAELARHTGFPLTTIESWKGANFIPEWRREKVIACAETKGVTLRWADFPSPDQRVSRASPSSDRKAA